MVLGETVRGIIAGHQNCVSLESQMHYQDEKLLVKLHGFCVTTVCYALLCIDDHQCMNNFQMCQRDIVGWYQQYENDGPSTNSYENVKQQKSNI